MDKLAYQADQVKSLVVDYTSKFRVYSAHLGVGDPERGGHHWSFSRSLEDDDGVCTVREIQRATLYEGIRSFRLVRTGLNCVFETAAVPEVGITELEITFAIDDSTWNELSSALDDVFRDRPYYTRAE